MHNDYLRCIVIHPTEPYIITSSDDAQIKIWDWDKQFTCMKIFTDHEHYVMQVVINPRDFHIMASASLDKTIKVFFFIYCTF